MRSLRARTTLAITLLSIVPNLVMILVVLTPVTPMLDAGVLLAFVGWLGVVVVLSALLGWFLAQELLKSLTDLTEQVTQYQHHLGRGVQLKHHPDAPTEVAAFTRAFNQLLEDMQLEQSRRSAFMATLMHDMKTPLVATNHVLEIITSPQISAAQRQELAQQITSENKRLITLVQKLVEAYRYERQDIQLVRVRCALEDIAKDVTERLRPLAKERHISLCIQGSAWTYVDADELSRALYNLADNAVRYARTSVDIIVAAKQLTLQDDGPGLPAPLEQLAEPFKQEPVEIAGQEFTAGTGGLGLFIAKSIIEAHQGSLEVLSSNAQGTTLCIHLPLV